MKRFIAFLAFSHGPTGLSIDKKGFLRLLPVSEADLYLFTSKQKAIKAVKNYNKAKKVDEKFIFEIKEVYI